MYNDMYYSSVSRLGIHSNKNAPSWGNNYSSYLIVTRIVGIFRMKIKKTRTPTQNRKGPRFRQPVLHFPLFAVLFPN